MEANSFSPANLICFLLGLAFCPLAASRCYADQPLPILAEHTAVITDRFGLSLVADLDLGLLPRGTRGLVALTLINNSSETIRIDRIQTNCACLSSHASAKSIEPGQQGAFGFILETPNVAATNAIGLSARLMSGEQGRDVRIAMRYMIAGVLAFESPLHVSELSPRDELQAFECQVFCTAPVVPEGIEITADPVFGNMEFDFHAKDQRLFLIGKLPSNAVLRDELSGRIVLKHAKTNQSTSMDLILRNKSVARVSPAVITLRRTDSQETFDGAAILQLEEDDDLDRDTVNQPIIDAISSDLSLQVTAKPLTRGTYKLRLTCRPNHTAVPELVKRPIDVTLNVKDQKRLIKLSSKLVFVD